MAAWVNDHWAVAGDGRGEVEKGKVEGTCFRQSTGFVIRRLMSDMHSVWYKVTSIKSCMFCSSGMAPAWHAERHATSPAAKGQPSPEQAASLHNIDRPGAVVVPAAATEQQQQLQEACCWCAFGPLCKHVVFLGS